MPMPENSFLALDNMWEVLVIIAVGVAIRLAISFLNVISLERRTSFIEFVDSGLIAFLLVFCVIRPFVVQAFWIPSGSMEPTLMVGDRILVNKFVLRFREPRRQEIIVFEAPPQASPEPKDFIKRVVALPGDEVEVRSRYIDEELGIQSQLYVNGIPQFEPFIKDDPDYEWGPRTVPDGMLLVLGDNRTDSNDGHRWGWLPRENVKGKAMCIFWPLQRIRILH